jgi:TRAP-type uncharacterized transport system substrate-binding protein
MRRCRRFLGGANYRTIGVLLLHPSRTAIFAIAGLLLVIGSVLALVYYWSPHATLRVTTGPLGGPANRLFTAFRSVSAVEHPHIKLELVSVPDLEAASHALETGKADLALVRSDVSPPSNGQTIAIVRRDVIAVVLPPKSPIKRFSQLIGKTIAIPTGLLQEENSRAFDLILGYFDIPPESIKRVYLPVSQIGAAIHHKRADAALAVGPIGPGEAVDLVSAIAKATEGAPEIMAIDEGDAIAKRFPRFESIDIPEGAFKAHPLTPNDTVKTVAVSYRIVAPSTMLNIVAGAIGRAIFRSKAKLMEATPLANQIEAPDPEDKNPVLPVHPGVAAYLSTGDQSFYETLQQYFYIVGVPLSLLGSMFAVLIGLWKNRRLEEDQQRIFRLLVISDEALKADVAQLDILEDEFRSIVSSSVSKLAAGSLGADQVPVMQLAIDHARRSIERRKAALSIDMPGPSKVFA